MPMFAAKYWSHDVLDPDTVYEYASSFYAEDLAQAERLASLRRIGEKVDGQGGNAVRRPSKNCGKGWQDFEYNFPAIMHGACFLSYIALMSGRLNAEEILGDGGILHELTHAASFSPRERRDCRITFKRTRALIKRLEDAAPENFVMEEQT